MKSILIINTGSPKTRQKQDVKYFIGAMLSDPLVMTLPSIIRNILAKGIIAPLRASSSAAHYSLIWGDRESESPLLHNTSMLARAIEETSGIPTEIAMRYGKPTISEAIKKLKIKCQNLDEIIVLPLFPQYAKSSYQTVENAIRKIYEEEQHSFKLTIQKPYYKEAGYINSLAESLKPYLNKGYDKLVFSFHSLPLSHVSEGREKGTEYDYVAHIEETIRLVSDALKLDPSKNMLVYSSAMTGKWLLPDLNAEMAGLPGKGMKKIVVITPGFPADNLETLYDIDIIARENFMKNGGEEFVFVPCLNYQDYWVQGLLDIAGQAQ